jgi:hypothetical protein
MPAEFPALIVGFNAFGLCFDELLGVRPDSEDADYKMNFFEYLKTKGYPFNWVKVVCFYKETAEVSDTPTVKRVVKLYKPNGSINDKFLQNLVDLVKEADLWGFKVQVCLFSYQAVNEPASYAPNPMPVDYNKVYNLGDPEDRLKTFFSPAASKVLTKQKELVKEIASRLKDKPNVFWELCNEAHMIKENSEADRKNLIKWMNEIRTALLSALGNQASQAKLCTSTGTKTQNEDEVAKALPVNFYDFHLLQWNKSDGGKYLQLINAAKRRAGTYPPPGAPLIINDDGGVDLPTSKPENKWRERNAANIQKWAAAAFGRGLGYMTKLPYPAEKNWRPGLLNAIAEAYKHPAVPRPNELDSDDDLE